MSDSFGFRGVNSKTGSPYTDDELKNRKQTRQDKHNRWLAQFQQSEDLGKCLRGMSLLKISEERAIALLRAGWNPEELAPLITQLKEEETKRQKQEEEKRRIEAEERKRIYDTPQNNCAALWKRGDLNGVKSLPEETRRKAMEYLEQNPRGETVPPLGFRKNELITYLRTTLQTTEPNPEKEARSFFNLFRGH